MPSNATSTFPWKNRAFLLLLGFVIVLSYLTYFHRYWQPAAVFWDENYHIASAQKYLNGVYYMEQHPPLGKLLIAFGEKLLHPNPENNQFLGTDYATNFPQGFSFAGYRFFSALLSWLTAPLLFLIFFLISRDALRACLLSFLYIFDNALIVHSRGAMLEGPLEFFVALTILAFFLVLTTRKTKWPFILSSVLFGVAFAGVMTTKVLGLIMILLIPAVPFTMLPTNKDRVRFFAVPAGILVLGVANHLLIRLLRRAGLGVFFSFSNFLAHPWTKGILLTALVIAGIVWLWTRVPSSRRSLTFMGILIVPFLIVYCSVWHMHFALGKTINAGLPDQGYYQASPEYRQLLAEGRTSSLLGFPAMLRDSLKYVTFYNRGAPRLDLCKTDENGSPPFFWPFGGRSINYRWETPDGQAYRYLYLQVNPVVWWAALAGVLVGAAFLVASWLLPPTRKLRNPLLLAVFVGMYVSYMLAVSTIDRVLYLYHYFIPLLFSFVVLGLVWEELQSFGKWTISPQGRTIGALALAGLIFLSHQYYRPLTYYEPLTDAQVERRAIFPLWELHCVNCAKESPFVVSCREPGT